MSFRQVVLDTETTGLRVEDGHRVIEIGCVELINRQLTGNTFHTYINPEREVEAGALAVHGITDDKLRNQPLFSAVAAEFVRFIDGAEMIIHNAPFDLGFLNHELSLCRQGWLTLTDYGQVIDTLLLARQKHVGQRNSLDALCKRYAIDNSKRDYHGALLDAHLLAHVYLAMTGGQGSFFDEQAPTADTQASEAKLTANHRTNEVHEIPVIKASVAELTEHEQYLVFLEQKGQCVWNRS